MRTSTRRWRRLSAERAHAQSERLDALLDDVPAGPIPPGSPFAAELAAARALAEALPLPPGQKGEELVALRAGLAARRSTRREVAGRRVQASFRLGSAVALGLVVVMAVLSSDPATVPGGPAVDAAESRANLVLANLGRKMEEVRHSVEDGDREKARRTSVAAADALVEARETAKLLPPGNPVRDKVLNETLDQVQTLQSLVSRMQLEVPPLQPRSSPAPTQASGAPPSAQGGTTVTSAVAVPASTVATTAPPSSVAPTSASSITSITTPPSSTTTTALPPLVTLPPPVVTTTTTAPPPTTTTTAAAPATTTTTRPATSTVTTTTAPPPSTTTTTTTTTTTAPPSTTPTTAAPSAPAPALPRRAAR